MGFLGKRTSAGPCGITQGATCSPSGIAMQIDGATSSDIQPAVDCLATAFSEDPITRFLLGTDSGYRERLTRFFSLLMDVRIVLDMPVLVARDTAGIRGAAMGYAAVRPKWPARFAEEWRLFEESIPGFGDRSALYDEIAEQGKPPVPHYYLGVIGTDPRVHGQGLGTSLLKSFCDRSASDRRSGGVFLETANPSNVRFYERAGFTVTGQGRLGNATLWCMFLRHERIRSD